MREICASSHPVPVYRALFLSPSHGCRFMLVKMAEAAINDFMPIIVEMMRNPPDPNKPLPLANHFGTAIAVTMPFLVRLSPWVEGPR